MADDDMYFSVQNEYQIINKIFIFGFFICFSACFCANRISQTNTFSLFLYLIDFVLFSAMYGVSMCFLITEAYQLFWKQCQYVLPVTSCVSLK